MDDKFNCITVSIFDRAQHGIYKLRYYSIYLNCLRSFKGECVKVSFAQSTFILNCGFQIKGKVTFYFWECLGKRE